MITRVFFAPRRGDLSTQQCLDHWRGAHSQIGAALPGVRSYVQNHGVLQEGRFVLPYPGFDIMPELEWDDLASMDAAIDSPAHEVDSIDDEKNFIDTSRTGYIVTARHVVSDAAPSPDAVKLITVLWAGVRASPAELATVLLGPYSTALGRSGPPRHEVLVALPDRRERPPFAAHAVDILWFDGVDDALAWSTSEAAYSASWHLAGVAGGAQRLIARPHRVV